MPVTRETVLNQVRQWADGRVTPRWMPVANNCFEGDSLFLWARAGTEAPPPDPAPATCLNCFGIFMLAVCHVDPAQARRRAAMKKLLLKAATLAGGSHRGLDPWTTVLAKGRLTRFNPATRAIPQPGQLVFLNGSGHVVMMDGVAGDPVDAASVRVLSFYGAYPQIPARTDTPTPIAMPTLAEIRDHYAALRAFQLRRMNQPVTPAEVPIEFADPFWA